MQDTELPRERSWSSAGDHPQVFSRALRGHTREDTTSPGETHVEGLEASRNEVRDSWQIRYQSLIAIISDATMPPRQYPYFFLDLL